MLGVGVLEVLSEIKLIELVRIGRCDDEQVLEQFNHELFLMGQDKTFIYS
jgi:hypothetical protein